jgi:hypothetical protein
LLWALGWPRSKYYGIAIAIAKGMSCLSYIGTGGGQQQNKEIKAWPRSRITNTRASQLIIIDGARIVKLYIFLLFLFLFFNLF